jgi:ataxin-3
MKINFFLQEESGNLADDGNYSIQVISKALSIWGLTAIPISNPEVQDAKENPLNEQAFICNLLNHWFTIRKFSNLGPNNEDEWYNLNSLLMNPQHLTCFYLSAFLDSLIMKGYTVFVIRGKLPQIQNNPLLIEEDKNWKKVKSKKKNFIILEDELKKAIELSLLQEKNQPSQNIQKSLYNEDIELKQGLALSEEMNTDENEDIELEKALKLSKELHKKFKNDIKEEPPKGNDTCEISFHLKDGSQFRRRFHKKDSIQALFSFLESKGFDPNKCELFFTLTKKKYSNLNTESLEDSDFFPNASLILQEK